MSEARSHYGVTLNHIGSKYWYLNSIYCLHIYALYYYSMCLFVTALDLCDNCKYTLNNRGATALLVAIATTRCLAVAQANYCNSFQLTHMPCGNRAQSIASNGGQKEDKTLLQHLRLSQHGEFWHASVSERQRSRPCGQNLCVPFLRTVLPPEVERALEQWRPTARQKRSYLHHQGEFQHQLLSFRSAHDSDHSGVVRISVGQS